MDESQRSSASTSSSHPAHLESLSVTVPCKTTSDALLATLSVSLREDLTTKVLDAFLELLRDPSFSSKDVTFQTAQDISRHISEQRKRIAQKRSSAGSRIALRAGTSSNSGLMRNVYGGIPQLIVDLVAQQLASEIVPFAEVVDWDTNMCNVDNTRCPREQDLLSMAVVHRTWTTPVSRVVRARAKLYGAKNIQSFLLSPRMGPWLREIYFTESLEYENTDEMVRLLRHLLQNAPNLRKLAIRTWCRLDSRNMYDFNDFAKELMNMRNLDALWLFPNRGQTACLPTLCEVLPRLRSLKALQIRNWMGIPEEESTANKELERLLSTTMSSSTRLTTLSFADGGINEATAVFLPWILRDCPLTNLEVHTKDIYKLESGSTTPVFRGLLPFLSKIKTLRIHYSSFNEDKECRTEFVLRCTNLKTLSLIVSLHHKLNTFPESVETLHVHYSTIWPVSDRQLHETLIGQESLKNLRTLRLTKDPIDAIARIMDLEGERPEDAWRIEDVKKLCEEEKIGLRNEYDFISFDELTRM